MGPRFAVGDLVALRADPDRCGPVMAVLPAVNGIPRYRVFHSATLLRDYLEDQLDPVEAAPAGDGLAGALAAGDGLDPATFRARLTAARLSHPLVDSLYALHAARIRHIPFQFKPLLRFLKADAPRLLVADEVGVGKTIEAGLILRELESRQRVDNVLILCPKALVAKWRAEMRRFDEDFQPLSADQLRYCLREAHLDGAWPEQYARSIVHLELLRREEYLDGRAGRGQHPGLRALDPLPHFSLVVVDEAHHLRNPETRAHDLASFLCDVGEAVVFLSATPVHVGAENLFTLLHLLRPDLFPDLAVFQAMVEPARHLSAAVRHVRHRSPPDAWMEATRRALHLAGETEWGGRLLGQDPRFVAWLERLAAARPLDDGERVACLRDLEELHPLANVVSRTRRRDIGRFTVREPHTVTAPFTPAQAEFYQALIDFRRRMLSLEHDPLVVRLILDTVERQAASCLPALAAALDSFLESGRFAPEAVSDATDDLDAEEERWAFPAVLRAEAGRLRDLARGLPDEDQKRERLLEVIRSASEGDGPGKVLVFSFFLHTLAYLERALRAGGVRVAVVSGRVDDEERERLRDRFRLPRQHPDAFDVLLSSEVGCEGLDYEFCDRLVNYDIPWNPMRVEQRIGRIDRFGQRSDKVLIYNFITPGTVEERIYYRCFERLGIFRDTVGDLEEVLGELTQQLNRAALDPALTPEQAEERAGQAADNAIRLIEERKRLEEAGGALLGLDPGLTDEVEALDASGKVVSPADLREMIATFLRRPEVGGRLLPDARRPEVLRLQLNREGRSALAGRTRALGRQDRTTVAFLRWLEGSDPTWPLTFDQATALEQRDLPFVTAVHPLARLAVADWQESAGPCAASLRVRDAEARPGRYLFIGDLWETVAVQPEVRLVGAAWDLDADRPAPEVAERLLPLLAGAEAADGAPPSPALARAFAALDEEANRLRLEALQTARERNATLLERKLASQRSYYEHRLGRTAQDAAAATDARIARMKAAELQRIEREYAQRCREIERRRETDIVGQRVAAGVLVVEGVGNGGD